MATFDARYRVDECAQRSKPHLPSAASLAAGHRNPGRRTTYGTLAHVGQFTLFEHQPDHLGGWQCYASGSLDVPLPFYLAATGLGAPAPNRQLLFRTLRLQIDVVSQLFECPSGRGQGARAGQNFTSASAGLKRFTSESVGLAVTAALAELRHQWHPVLGWPVDLDLLLQVGMRPDLLFTVPGGHVMAESRGRSGSTRWRPGSTSDQRRRISDLQNEYPNTKTFMAWASFEEFDSRVDYFDPGEVRPIVDSGALEELLSSEARTAFDDALQSETARVESPLGPVLGDWTLAVGQEEIFIGLMNPDGLALQRQEPSSIHRRQPTGDDSFAQIGPVVVLARPRSSDRRASDLLATFLADLG